jgi:hypothetical protein
MGARKRYNLKRITLQEQLKATVSAEKTARTTIAMAEGFTKKFEQETSLLRHECQVLRKKAETIAKFASELITSPAETTSRIDRLEEKVLAEFGKVKARLGIPVRSAAQTAATRSTVQ